MERAACREADSTLFHPDQGWGDPYADARAICLTCPVIARCLKDALGAMTSDGDDDMSIAWGAHGMWGGTTPRERFRLLGKAWAA